MEGVERPWSEQTQIEDLPFYFSEPFRAEPFDLRRVVGDLSRAYRSVSLRSQRPGAPSAPCGGRTPGTVRQPRHFSPVFDRMVPLRRQQVAAVLDAWWCGPNSGVVRVQRRLQLSPPKGDLLSGWEMRGRVRRCTSLHWVPVVVELWAKYEGYVRITLTPQSRVLASRRYFRLGNSIVDRLCQDLAKAPIDAEGATR